MPPVVSGVRILHSLTFALGTGRQSSRCPQELETCKALADERCFLTACGTGLDAVLGLLRSCLVNVRVTVMPVNSRGLDGAVVLQCSCDVVDSWHFAPVVVDGGG